MNDNWTVRKWKDYLYIHQKNADICCPSCDFKTKGKDEFIRHNLKEHYDSVIEECDSIVFTIESQAFHGKILPKSADFAWAMSDDTTQSLEKSKVHMHFKLKCDSSLESHIVNKSSVTYFLLILYNKLL